ncbi:Arogenate dehydratase protein, partial [Dioscorea alata]
PPPSTPSVLPSKALPALTPNSPLKPPSLLALLSPAVPSPTPSPPSPSTSPTTPSSPSKAPWKAPPSATTTSFSATLFSSSKKSISSFTTVFSPFPGVLPTHLKTVISHPMALAHCHRSLNRLGLNRQPVEDTAGAVEMLLDNQLLDTAAIASPRAAQLYGLNVLAHGLQDESWNVTRFLILSKHPNINNNTNTNTNTIVDPITLPTAVTRDEQIVLRKTSIVIAHRGGCMLVILKVLKAFSSRNLNMTKLEVINHEEEEGKSPVMILDVSLDGKKGSLKAFPHVLYVDFEGSMEDFRVREAIDEISKFSVFVRILGTYSADPNVYDLH